MVALSVLLLNLTHTADKMMKTHKKAQKKRYLIYSFLFLTAKAASRGGYFVVGGTPNGDQFLANQRRVVRQS
jgi:hypothetical protein